MRRRILLLVATITALVVLAFAVPVGILLNSAVAQRAEHSTIEQANAAGSYLRSATPTTSAITAYVSSVAANTGRPISISLPDGTVVGTAPTIGGRGPLPGTGAGPPGFHPNGDGSGPTPTQGPDATLHHVAGGEVAATSVTTDAGTYLVTVFLSDSALHSGEGKWWGLLITGSVALLILALVAGEVLTRRIVRPLTITAQTAHRMSAGDTTARAPIDGPREIAEVGSALNRLGDRIDELISEERETVADLSHRLRTPLTALRLDAEALRDHAEAERIGTHVSALERMLTAVIHAARRPQREGRMPSCDAAAVVGERVRFWSALTDDQRRDVVTDFPPEPLLVRASGEDLAAAVDALLENVVAHTPEGTAFSVRLTPTEAGAQVDVADAGPGIPTDAEVRGRSDRGSSGLGLDIARRCAEAGGGSMRIGRSDAGGALITLLLNAP